MYKKNEVFFPSKRTWIELKGIMLTELSHTKKDKYCMMSHVKSKDERTKGQKQGNKLLDTEN